MSNKQILTEWNSISTRIKSLLKAGNYLFRTFQVINADPQGALKKFILPTAKKTFGSVSDFGKKFGSSLPPHVTTYLNSFIEENKQIFNIERDSQDQAKEGGRVLLTALACLEVNISYYMNDIQSHIRKTVEVAFAHLQRQLMVDKNIRNSWETAEREEDYEKLGGAHLLLHKIWAFKINATGERTDLVLSEPIKEESILGQSVDGLALTEWKVVGKMDEITEKIEQAKTQAKKYATGSLYALELSTHRYLIMVSKDYIKIPNDTLVDGEVVYRVINIVYSPSAPSVAARDLSRH